jgi:hypothetical protein
MPFHRDLDHTVLAHIILGTPSTTKGQESKGSERSQQEAS